MNEATMYAADEATKAKIHLLIPRLPEVDPWVLLGDSVRLVVRVPFI